MIKYTILSLVEQEERKKEEEAKKKYLAASKPTAPYTNPLPKTEWPRTQTYLESQIEEAYLLGMIPGASVVSKTIKNKVLVIDSFITDPDKVTGYKFPMFIKMKDHSSYNFHHSELILVEPELVS